MKEKNRITRLIIANLGAAIRAERCKRDISQEKLADLSGVSRQRINAIEKGKTEPGVSIVYRIGAALGVDLFSAECTRMISALAEPLAIAVVPAENDHAVEIETPATTFINADPLNLESNGDRRYFNLAQEGIVNELFTGPKPQLDKPAFLVPVIDSNITVIEVSDKCIEKSHLNIDPNDLY